MLYNITPCRAMVLCTQYVTHDGCMSTSSHCPAISRDAANLESIALAGPLAWLQLHAPGHYITGGTTRERGMNVQYSRRSIMLLTLA